MSRLSVFNNITLDGYFADQNNDMSWAHRNTDPEWNEFVASNARGEGTLVFGRITYQMMAGWWPTPPAIKAMPEVAEKMNESPKMVFSRTLDKATWNNTRLVKGDLAAEIRKLKKAPGHDMVIMGSGTIVAQLAQEGLIDEYQLAVHPIVLGRGRTLFDGLKDKKSLKLTKTRAFANGTVFACYDAAG